MKQFALIFLCSFLFGCASVQNVPELTRELNRQNSQIVNTKSNILQEYTMIHAQYEVVKRQIKEKNIPEYERLKSIFSTITQLKNEFLKRSTNLKTKADQQRRAFGNKSEITTDDPEWETLYQYKKYAKSELQSLISIYNKYRKEGIDFTKTLNSKELAPYIARMPRNRLEAHNILKESKKEQAYETYNEELIASLKIKAESTLNEFESLAELARYFNIIAIQRFQSSSFPDGKTGPSIETKDKARALISSRINTHIVSAAKSYSSKFKTANDAIKHLLYEH